MTNFDYLDQDMFDIAHRIERFGYTTISVNTGECTVPGCPCADDPGPTWTYSIGMLEHNHPEIVIVGAPALQAHALIDAVFEWHHRGIPLPSGRDGRVDAAGMTITTVPVPDRCWTETDLMAYWHNYYQSVGWPSLGSFDEPVLQLVIADDSGHFPWDARCDAGLVGRQPIIADDDSAWLRSNRATRRSSQRKRRRKGRGDHPAPGRGGENSILADGLTLLQIERKAPFMTHGNALAIRQSLDYPIVDSDGHVLEVMPVFVEYLRETASPHVAEAFASSMPYQRFSSPWLVTPEQRRHNWTSQSNLWGWPTKNTLDRATATIPGLYATRMDDLGIDYSLLYPSAGLFVVTIADPEMREEVVRAYNRFVMDLMHPYADRMSAVASIPMHTPEEAIRHLDYAVGELGHKVVCMQGWVDRPIPAALERAPGLAEYGTRLDYFGLDSEYDYDPVWAKCVELKVAPTFHSSSGLRAGRSVTNYTQNHIGSIAEAQEGLAKSLFFGGVTRRFPTLNFGFLECGAAWACSLFADIVGHYEKRSLSAMEYVDPKNLDVDKMMQYFEDYADPFTKKHMDAARGYYSRDFFPLPEKDDFWKTGITDIHEIVDLFANRFYIGCEADDRSVAWAFNRKINPFGTAIRAMFGSDVGHWDVIDVGDVVVEAQELVDDDLITSQDFKEFMFWNPVELHARVNPDFFKGTRVEAAVDTFMREGRV